MDNTTLGASPRLTVVQNIGLADRVIRTIIGVALLGGGMYVVLSGNTISWEAYLMAVSVYPLLTAILGWDPVYGAMGTRTCRIDGDGRNQCGTFPYEVDAALGHNPTPDRGFEYDHSLTGAHHESTKHAA